MTGPLLRALLLAVLGLASAASAQGQATRAQPADPLVLVRRLVEAGAPQLALDRIGREAPSDRSAAAWNDWEGLRCAALSALHRDGEVVERVAKLPGEWSSPALASCAAAAAHALAALEQYEDARRYAARALWDFKPAPRELEALRRLVIDSYVAERRGDDAYRAMLRFQQDYGPLPKALLGRFVTALLDLDKNREALTWLAPLDDTQPAKLALRLRSGLVTPEAALKQAQAALAKGGDAGYWRVVFDAAPADAPGLGLAAREHLLEADPRKSQAQSLWRAYLAVAERSANRARLLVGDDAGWMDHAARLLPKDPALARAFLADLAQRGTSAATRQGAQSQLLASLAADRLERTAVLLFQAAFADVDALDTALRYRLGAVAEASGDARYAVRLWQDLPSPPESDASAWMLRVARARWRAERRDTGVDRLVRQYAGRPSLSRMATQDAARYAAELDDAGRHAAASRLFEAVLPYADAAEAKTVVLGLARARAGAGEYGAAAEAYLGLALGPDPLDRSALQARLQAAAALSRAGYAQDARAQLEWLVANAKDREIVEAARSALKRR